MSDYVVCGKCGVAHESSRGVYCKTCFDEKNYAVMVLEDKVEKLQLEMKRYEEAMVRKLKRLEVEGKKVDLLVLKRREKRKNDVGCF